MATGVILAIDQGTTNTKALLVDGEGVPVFRASRPVSVLQPRAGWVEQDPAELWESVRRVISDCVAFASGGGLRVDGVAISNQRETALAWHVGEVPLAVGNAVSWQCRRSAEVCERLWGRADRVREICGLPVDPLASAGKWAWMLEHMPGLRAAVMEGEVRLGNVDAWLLANLTGGESYATDHTNASRTALFDLKGMGWSWELAEIFGVPQGGLPEVKASASRFGICLVEGLEGVPVVAMVGDSHAAMFGHGSYAPGAAKATYGTGSSLMMLTRWLAKDSVELARTIAWSVEGPAGAEVQFALEGNVAMTGSAVQWVGEFLGLTDPVGGAVALAASVEDAGGVVFVPGMVGLGAPHWDTGARGLVAGLERGSRAAHLARAAVDAIGFQVADVLFAMERLSGAKVAALHVDGGATKNDGLMQMQADLIGRPVLRGATEELSALGAAWLGGVTLGWWTLEELEGRARVEDRFEPENDRAAQYGAWTLAVRRARLGVAHA